MTISHEESRLSVQELESLARRFHCDPGFVLRLYEASDVFREICGDYATCRETLEKYRRLNQVDDTQVRDYTEMRDQLERELRGCLENGRANG